jgi:AraC family transcriptional regulator, regulatory protein of adaptative response / methylated-DNA-[protein]-cysteine methyltransferase
MTSDAARMTRHGDPRWESVLTRNSTADGTFVFAVKTTGIFCRPSCPAKTAKPENVLFFDNPDQAAAAGFRPCRRCNPTGQSVDETNIAIIAAACRMIERSEEIPKLNDIAAAMGFSASHFHRLFKATTGLTPKAYASAHRMNRLRNELTSEETSVTKAIYDAGFNASSRFYTQSNKSLGMTPKRYKHGGHGVDIRFAVGQCSYGAILVAASDKGICSIAMHDDPDVLVKELQDLFPKANLVGGDEAFERVVAEVIGFVDNPGIGLNLPLDIQGTAFQQRVWQALADIPVGQMVTYRDIASAIGAPKAVRAVAQACAANKIAVAIPCHRVVRSDGDISGYRWGVERKRAILEVEATAI